MRLTTLLLIVVVVGLPVWGFLWIKGTYDEAMFRPKPRDRETMTRALGERFGSKVTLLELPVVNRDVNGYAGVVTSVVPLGQYQSEGHAFSFERIDGRDVCLMTHLPWELEPLRATYRRRNR